MLDALVIRTAGDSAHMHALAQQNDMAIINAMSADEHPTQALSDITFLRSHFQSPGPLRTMYVGEGNNTAAALCLLMARLANVELHLRTPRGYGLSADTMRLARLAAAHSGALISERHDLSQLPNDVNVIYTTQWQTTGTTKADPHWRTHFESFQVTKQLMATYPNAIFMHDLPAHRGEEVAPEVIDGTQSVVFEQATYKMYSAMAVLEWAIFDTNARTSPS
jgi:ornithine carbamoyltransferase